MDVKAVGAVLTYAMIAQDFATLTGGAGLHTGERHLKYGHFLGQTLYAVELLNVNSKTLFICLNV